MEEIDFDTLATITGGTDYTQGQGFRGRMFGGDGYIGPDDQQRNEALFGHLNNAGFSVQRGTAPNGEGPSLNYTAKCGRPNCGWNGYDGTL